eukprot:NODE_3130_length_702_cov_132.289433_g2219_i0.p4 GENE.NODE_3130_length_702_cov_132.289433_g2219_i0~~NODE_3130_length_702_cov_132.289433_g2219_i0.p4  ORF type:complete len:61 (-),score=3.17 NODE_3130_length_702_cov_132.289433_g2219_i0:288-470(-)
MLYTKKGNRSGIWKRQTNKQTEQVRKRKKKQEKGIIGGGGEGANETNTTNCKQLVVILER